MTSKSIFWGQMWLYKFLYSLLRGTVTQRIPLSIPLKLFLPHSFESRRWDWVTTCLLPSHVCSFYDSVAREVSNASCLCVLHLSPSIFSGLPPATHECRCLCLALTPVSAWLFFQHDQPYLYDRHLRAVCVQFEKPEPVERNERDS